jgi:hypothetical protein
LIVYYHGIALRQIRISPRWRAFVLSSAHHSETVAGTLKWNVGGLDTNSAQINIPRRVVQDSVQRL